MWTAAAILPVTLRVVITVFHFAAGNPAKEMSGMGAESFEMVTIKAFTPQIRQGRVITAVSHILERQIFRNGLRECVAYMSTGK